MPVSVGTPSAEVFARCVAAIEAYPPAADRKPLRFAEPFDNVDEDGRRVFVEELPWTDDPVGEIVWTYVVSMDRAGTVTEVFHFLSRIREDGGRDTIPPPRTT
ncbi:MAG: hypothetical protein U0169_25555 [Polyangiaceae bacterium]